MEIVVATNNPHKLDEIKRMLKDEGHKLYSLEEVGAVLSLPEDGETFADNALIKAKEACQRSGLAAIGDDSGLCVDVLDGAPGVHSARFAGEHDDAANNKKLLMLLERTPYAGRTASFVSVVALVLPNGSGLQVEGRCKGMIGFEKSGSNGFGYDPLFYVNGRSFADMSDEEKDAISHRSVALRQLREQMPAFLAKQEQTNGE